MKNRTIASTFAAGLLGMALGGCMEGEKMVYKSTPFVPETITLKNIVYGAFEK